MAFGSLERKWDEDVGWKFFLPPDITNLLKMLSYLIFFPGAYCRDQEEEMCKIKSISSLCWGFTLCYSQLELKAHASFAHKPQPEQSSMRKLTALRTDI